MKGHITMMISPKLTLLAGLILSASFVLSGCQTKEVQPPTVAEINSYAIPVLERSINHITLLNACKTLGSPIAEEAAAHYEQWLGINGRIAEAADNFTSRHQTDYIEYNNGYYSLSAIMKVNTIQTDVLDYLNLKQRSPSSQKNVCRSEFKKAIETPLSALQPSSEIANALLESGKTKLSNQYASVLDTAKDDVLANAPGKSFYKVSGDLTLLCENNLTLITLKNTWPKETYAAYCQNSALASVQCSWGNCKQHEPTSYQP